MNDSQKKVVELIKHKANSIQITVNQDGQTLNLRLTDKATIFQIGLAVQSFFMQLDKQNKPNRKKPHSPASDFF